MAYASGALPLPGGSTQRGRRGAFDFLAQLAATGSLPERVMLGTLNVKTRLTRRLRPTRR
jgi:hypothetical protein